MKLLTLLCGISAAAAFKWASSSTSVAIEAGRVFAGDRVFNIYDMGEDNVRVITDKENGEFVRPGSYRVNAGYACKFYSESTRGVGYLIGHFQGPNFGDFGLQHYAAFYECWVSGGNKVRHASQPAAQVRTLKNIHDVDVGDGDIEGDIVGVEVFEGYTCTFEWEHDGTKERLATLAGPTVKGFWNMHPNKYSCQRIQPFAELTHRNAPELSPCGFVRTASQGSYALNETGKKGFRLANFAHNGVMYNPTFFRVNQGCFCNFYSAITTREGAQRLVEAKGGQEGTFKDGQKAARYECWRN